MTFKQAKDRNLHVNAGEKSVPIFKWGLSIKDEKGKTVSEEDYNAMSKEERDKFSVRPYPKVYHVSILTRRTYQRSIKRNTMPLLLA